MEGKNSEVKGEEKELKVRKPAQTKILVFLSKLFFKIDLLNSFFPNSLFKPSSVITHYSNKLALFHPRFKMGVNTRVYV